MKSNCSILVIDDTSQKTEISSIQSNLKTSYNVDPQLIVTKDVKYRVDGGNDLDFEKLKVAIDESFNKMGSIDLILLDFDLGEKDRVDGLKVAEYIASIRPGARIMMYSANLGRLIRSAIHVKDDKFTEDHVVEAIAKFMKYKIVKCLNRHEYVDEVTKYFNGNKQFSLEVELSKKLRLHDNLKFLSCCPKLKGKTMGEIADMIEKRSDALYQEWCMALIDQLIAYTVQVNEEES